MTASAPQPHVGSSPSRVLHLVASTRRRGAELFGVDLARALDWRQLRNETFALTGGGSLAVDHVGQGRFHPRTLRALRDRASDAMVVVAHGSSTLLAAYVATLGTDVPFIYRNIGDPDHWVDTRFGTRTWRVGALLRRADTVVALWPGAKDALIARHHLDPTRVAIAANGVPVERFPTVTPPERLAARQRLKMVPEGPVLCSIGSLSSEKDPLTALRAAALVDGARLVVAGDGPLRPTLQQVGDTLMPGRVVFVSEVSDVREVLAAADVLLLTSRTEGLPAVLIEAGLSGLPVVATSVGGVAEIVEDGETGHLVPVGDPAAAATALREALRGGPTMGTRARLRCEQHFSFDVIADQWAAILRDPKATAHES